MKVNWTRVAISQLDSIYEFIGRNSPYYAQVTVDRITARSKQIEAFPNSGHIVPEYGDTDIREVLIGSYRIKQTEIQVLAVIHGARLLADDPPRLEP
jgi:toxin ParE1/3/4